MRDLELVIALHEAGSFSQAAVRVGLSEPAVSKRIQSLERQVKVRLFERHRNGVRITEPGQSFIHHAINSIRSYRMAVHEAQEANHSQHQRLRVGVSSMLPSRLIELLHSAEMAVRQSRQIEVVSDQASAVIDSLMNGFLDLVLVPSAPLNVAITSQRIARSPLLIAVQRTHPLAGNRETNLGELLEFPWAFFNRAVHPDLHDSVLNCLEASEKKPRIQHLIGQQELTAIALVRDSVAAWLTPIGAEFATQAGLVCIPLAEPKIALETHLATLGSNQSPFLSEFVRKFVKLVEVQGLPVQMPLPMQWNRETS
jgi:DNA-binding transcriptional LysR family regulator